MRMRLRENTLSDGSSTWDLIILDETTSQTVELNLTAQYEVSAWMQTFDICEAIRKATGCKVRCEVDLNR